MRRVRAIILILAVLTVAGGVGLARWLRARRLPAVSLTLAMQPFEYGALFYVAEEQGYLRDQGITLQWLGTESGPAAMNALRDARADLAICGEYPVVAAALKGTAISVLASVDKFETWYLVARKSRGIQGLADLPGKRVAVQRGTIGEFYLGRMLDLAGLRAERVALVDTPLLQMGQALLDGRVDASLALQYDLKGLQDGLGDDAVTIPIQKGQSGYALLLARPDWLAVHHDVVERVLRGLDRAERYSLNNPDAARAIVQRMLARRDEEIASSWPAHQISLSLDRSLLIAMEDEGRWMIAHGLTEATSLPDLQQYIDLTGLEKVRPGSVNLFR